MNTDYLCLVYRRAIELCFALINDSNVKSLTKEIVSFLSDGDMEFRHILHLISFLQLRSKRRSWMCILFERHACLC